MKSKHWKLIGNLLAFLPFGSALIYLIIIKDFLTMFYLLLFGIGILLFYNLEKYITGKEFEARKNEKGEEESYY